MGQACKQMNIWGPYLFRLPHDPFGGVKWPFCRAHISDISIMIHIAVVKLQLWSSNEIIFIVGSHHNIRNCIKGVTTLGRLRVTSIDRGKVDLELFDPNLLQCQGLNIKPCACKAGTLHWAVLSVFVLLILVGSLTRCSFQAGLGFTL